MAWTITDRKVTDSHVVYTCVEESAANNAEKVRDSFSEFDLSEVESITEQSEHTIVLDRKPNEGVITARIDGDVVLKCNVHGPGLRPGFMDFSLDGNLSGARTADKNSPKAPVTIKRVRDAERKDGEPYGTVTLRTK